MNLSSVSLGVATLAAVFIIIIAALLSTVTPLQWLSVAVVVGAAAVLGWLSMRAAREAARQQAELDELRRVNETLAAQADVRAADLRDADARLRSILDSAVDGIIVIDEQGRIEAFNPGAGAPVWLPGLGSTWTKRQHADALPVPRGA